jgi:hypothetical protein
MTATELTTTVRNLKGLMNMRDELEAEIAAAQDQIKAEMTARDTDEMTVDVSKVTRKPSTAQVVALLEFFARFHPAGLGLLLGGVRDPSAAEIADMIRSFSSQSDLGTRISGGLFIPEAERVAGLYEAITGIIDSIGGWAHIHEMAREVRADVSAGMWSEAADYAANIAPGGMVRDGAGGMGGRMFGAGAGRHDICGRTARRRFRNLMRVMALKILSFPPDGGFELNATTGGGYPR